MSAVFILFLVICAGIGYKVYTLDIFKVSGSNIHSNIKLNHDFRRKIEGETLFALDVQELASFLLSEHPEYKTVRISKKFPDALLVQIQPRQAFAQIKGIRFYPVDRDAVVLSDGASDPYEGLILVTLKTQNDFFRKGSSVGDEGLLLAFDLIDTLRREGLLELFGVELVNSAQRQALYFLISEKDSGESAGAIKVIIGAGELDKKIKLFKNLIEEKLADKMDLVKYIDLRYKKVYVGFKR
jgi:cell division septal protein FtsQ